jgi:hypothetical protein
VARLTTQSSAAKDRAEASAKLDRGPRSGCLTTDLRGPAYRANSEIGRRSFVRSNPTLRLAADEDPLSASHRSRVRGPAEIVIDQHADGGPAVEPPERSGGSSPQKPNLVRPTVRQAADDVEMATRDL